jgi:phospholipid/cholesterol/gamma-HCH transport system substrate-binding protein
MARANHTIEIGTGLFVLLGLAALAFLTTQLPNSGLQLHSADATYKVTAKFDNIGGLKVGAPVTMAGVRVGSVDAVGFDPQDYRAVVTMDIDRQYNHIPDDSDASIQTSGLLGAQYVGLGAGGSDSYLKQGSQIQFTQSAIVLETLINKFFANFASKNDSSKSDSGGGGSSGTGGDGAGAGHGGHGGGAGK